MISNDLDDLTCPLPPTAAGAAAASAAYTSSSTAAGAHAAVAPTAAAAAAAAGICCPLETISTSTISCCYEQIMPGIYFTTDFIHWNEEKLRENNFKHILIIDKHIQELYYPSALFKLNIPNPAGTTGTDVLAGDSSSDTYASAYDYLPAQMTTAASLRFGAQYDVLNLNFGEKSYLTTVLPNCYRAVRFIRKAEQASAPVLIIDCNGGGTQKCITIVVAYLMYKHNIKFGEAFARLKQYYKKADLDRFYANQLYEYEPILQVQRASACGQSCSRELRAALFKRKINDNDNSIETEERAPSQANINAVDNTLMLNPLSFFQRQCDIAAENIRKAMEGVSPSYNEHQQHSTSTTSSSSSSSSSFQFHPQQQNPRFFYFGDGGHRNKLQRTDAAATSGGNINFSNLMLQQRAAPAATYGSGINFPNLMLHFDFTTNAATSSSNSNNNNNNNNNNNTNTTTSTPTNSNFGNGGDEEDDDDNDDNDINME